MAPAVTSETAPCARDRHLRATIPSSPLNGDSAEVSETMSEMSSQLPASEASSAVNCNESTSSFHPFACIPSAAAGLSSGVEKSTRAESADRLELAETDSGTASRVSEMVNGIGITASQGVPPSLGARLVDLKNAQRRTVNIVIKNNGACGSGVLPNSAVTGLLQPAVQSTACNGGSTLRPCEQLAAFSGAQPIRPDPGTMCGRFPIRAPPPVHRMLILPRMPAHHAAIASTTATSSDSARIQNSLHLELKTTNTTLDSVVPAATGEKDSNAETTSVKCSKLSLEIIAERQRQLLTRAERTLRRLRRLQSREANSFVRRQLGGLVNTLRLPASEATAGCCFESKSVADYKNMSTSELVGLVQRMQSSDSLPAEKVTSESSQLDSSVCAGLSDTAGRLTANLRHLESAIDSDATESSSGGESDDESSVSNDEYVILSDSHSRMKARLSWVSERAMIASRWTWLQAQVSDLEYRIRQQSDIYRQLRAVKGAVSFREAQTTDGMLCGHHQLSTTVAHQLSTEPVLGETRSTTYDTTLPGSDKETLTAVDSSCRAARCLPVRQCRRRRLLQPSTVSRLSANRNAMSLYGSRCTGCYPPATPCALCTGKLNNTAGLRPHLPLLDRIALLDPAFHHVLSFPQDVLLSVRLAESVRQLPVTDHVPVSESSPGKKGLTIKISKASLKSLQMSSAAVKNLLKNDLSSSMPRQSSTLSSGDNLGAAPLGTGSFNAGVKTFQRHMTSRRATLGMLRRKKHFGLSGKRLGRSATATGLKLGRPPRLSHSASSASLSDSLRRQNSRSMFDINNVVIPYGARAAAMRLEILEYKEIVTPKWRIIPKAELLPERRASSSSVPKKRLRLDFMGWRTSSLEDQGNGSLDSNTGNLPVAGSSEVDTDSEVEDLSDEAFAARHLRYEVYEKKQCLPFSGQHRRSRSNRSESDQSTVVATPRSPDAAQLEGVCDSALTLSCQSVEPVTLGETNYDIQEPLSPLTLDGHVRRSSSASSFTRTQSFCFDLPRCEEPMDIVPERSWPIRSFPLADSDFEQLQVDEPLLADCLQLTSVARPPLPFTSSLSAPILSAVSNTDDSADHEWTVGAQQNNGVSEATEI